MPTQTKVTLRTATPNQLAGLPDTPPLTCPTCGSEFTPTRHWQIFCSTKCRKHSHSTTTIIAKYEDQIKALQQKVEDLEKELKIYK